MSTPTNYQRALMLAHAFTPEGRMPALSPGSGKTVVAVSVRRPVKRCDYCGTLEGEQHRGGCPDVNL